MKARLVFATLSELVKRTFEFDKSLKVISNGEDNDYAERVERLIENSITAKQCRKLFQQFITGKGFGDELNAIKVNDKKDITFFELFTQFNREFATHNGAYVHVMYNLAGEPVRYSVVPYSRIRIGAKDSQDFVGRFAEYYDWENPKKNDFKWLNSFIPDPKIVQSQIKKAKSIEKYKGQLYFFNPSNTDYPLAHIHPVLNDADSEFRGGVFKNKSLRKGFFGKNILVTPPRIDPNLTSVDVKNLSKEDLFDLRHQEDMSDSVTETLKSFVGVENNEGFMTLEMEFEGDNIDKAIKHIKIETDIDDKLFAYTEESASNNIRKAYNNVPKVLVDSSDNSLFGKSGEAFIQAKRFYQEQTEDERMMVLQAFKKLFKNFNAINTDSLQIVKLIDDGVN